MVQKNKGNFWERNRLLLGVIGAIAALLIFSGWMMRRGAVSVRMEKVIRQEIANVISTNGKIEPVANFEAHAHAPLIVKEILVREGDPVKAGQTLLKLDDAEAKAQVAKALAQLRSAEADAQNVKTGGTQDELLTTRSQITKAQTERDAAARNLQAVQRLQQRGAAAPAEVEQAQNRLKAADAEIQFLQSKLTDRFSNPEIVKAEAAVSEAKAAHQAALDVLKNAVITAPFAGTVYQVPVKRGAYVNTGELLVQMANLKTVQVRAFVDEPEIGKLAIGEKVEVTWDALPGKIWAGTLTRIPSTVAALGPRTVGEITCEIPNTDRKLLPNVNVNVNIVTARQESALTVSREAIHDFDGKRMVFEVVDGKVRTTEVQTGTSSLTRVEVVNGLSEGATIALGALNSQPLRNGMEVKAAER